MFVGMFIKRRFYVCRGSGGSTGIQRGIDKLSVILLSAGHAILNIQTLNWKFSYA